MICGKCKLGTIRRIVGNGITEPPYVRMVQCPFDDEDYKYLDAECNHTNEAAQAGEGE